MADLELYGFEWDVRQRAAEAVARGDAIDPRDLEWLAEGYLKLLELIEDAKDEISTLESDLEEAKDGADEIVGRWETIDTGEVADMRVVVAVTRSMYKDLIEQARINGIDEPSEELDIARVTFSILKMALDMRKAAREVAKAVEGMKKALSA